MKSAHYVISFAALLLLSPDSAQAKSILERALLCKGGDPAACEKLEVSCLDKSGESCESLGRIAADNDRIHEAMSYFHQGCEYGSKFSCEAVGIENRQKESMRGDFEKIERMQREVAHMQAQARRNSQPRQNVNMNNAALQNFSNFLKDSPKPPPAEKNCESTPVRDMYSKQIIKWDTTCN